MLKPEFINMLHLDVLGFDNPVDPLSALDTTQAEFCHSGFSPNEIFEINLNLLQCITRDGSPVIDHAMGSQINNILLNHLATQRFPDRITTLNYRSGHKMVESNFFVDCNLIVGNCTVQSFAHVALYLGHHLAISVLFARIV